MRGRQADHLEHAAVPAAVNPRHLQRVAAHVLRRVVLVAHVDLDLVALRPRVRVDRDVLLALHALDDADFDLVGRVDRHGDPHARHVRQ